MVDSMFRHMEDRAINREVALDFAVDVVVTAVVL